MTNKYKIRWILNPIRLGKRGKRSISLGFCEKTRKVAFISVSGTNDIHEAIKPYLVVDVYVNGECEDGRFCWNLECPHNRATAETLKKYLDGKPDSDALRIASKRLQRYGKSLISDINWSDDGIIVYRKAPIVLYKERRRKTK